jgi:hypothetical protein
MYMLYPYNKKNRYMIQCTRRVSGITFIRYMYTYRQAIGKPTNLKDLAASKSKDETELSSSDHLVGLCSLEPIFLPLLL